MSLRFLKLPALFLFAGLCSLMFSGCGGSSSSSLTGPGSGSSFGGTTISINPTIQFLVDGTTVSYQNSEPGSIFPQSPSATTGTYIYTPGSNYTTGVLSITLGGSINTTLTINLSNFAHNGTAVSTFVATYNGVNYTGSVTSGTLVAYVAPTGGSPTPTPTPTPGSGAVSATLTAVEVNGGSPYPANTQLAFVVSKTTLSFPGHSLSGPSTVRIDSTQNDYVFTDGTYKYLVRYNGDVFQNQIAIHNSADTYLETFVLNVP